MWSLLFFKAKSVRSSASFQVILRMDYTQRAGCLATYKRPFGQFHSLWKASPPLRFTVRIFVLVRRCAGALAERPHNMTTRIRNAGLIPMLLYCDCFTSASGTMGGGVAVAQDGLKDVLVDDPHPPSGFSTGFADLGGSRRDGADRRLRFNRSGLSKNAADQELADAAVLGNPRQHALWRTGQHKEGWGRLFLPEVAPATWGRRWRQSAPAPRPRATCGMPPSSGSLPVGRVVPGHCHTHSNSSRVASSSHCLASPSYPFARPSRRAAVRGHCARTWSA